MGLAAVCLDSGNTLVDESTETKDDRGVVQRAELLPGAAELLHRIDTLRIPIALVADGRLESLRNIYRSHRLWHLFRSISVSEQVGVTKPHEEMFLTAIEPLGIKPTSYSDVVMVGNRLDRDIAGSNRLGMISIWLRRGSDAYSEIPLDRTEIPRYEVTHLGEAGDIIARLHNSRA
jgi:FMN phosphatase YigB (HAD superfamily)